MDSTRFFLLPTGLWIWWILTRVQGWLCTCHMCIQRPWDSAWNTVTQKVHSHFGARCSSNRFLLRTCVLVLGIAALLCKQFSVLIVLPVIASKVFWCLLEISIWAGGQCWNLNSGPYTCQAGHPFPIEPCLFFFFPPKLLVCFSDKVSCFSPRPTSDHNLYTAISCIVWDYRYVIPHTPGPN
jgi:hypothetical protein